MWGLNLAAAPLPSEAEPASMATSPPRSAIPATSRQTTPLVPLRRSERSAEPARLSGVERRAVLRWDSWRSVATALLLPVRKLVELQFLGINALSAAARGLRFEQRAEDFFSPKEGEVKLLPTLFFETRHPVSFGARAVAFGSSGETRLALSSGGPHDVTARSEVLWFLAKPGTADLSVEALYDTRDNLEYLGVGQVPSRDARNVFRPNTAGDGRYLELRSRALASLDVFVVKGVSVVPSASLLIGRVEDAPEAGSARLSQVFEATRLVENAAVTRVFYSELALRYASRRGWAGRDVGGQLEGYLGYGAGRCGEDLRYVGAGARSALFVPIVRPTNTLSPKLVLDGVAPISGEIPFTVLVRQPEFRGFDLRRDRLSLLASLDYRWVLARSVAARLFADAATVAPRFGELFVNMPRFAAGFGLDLVGRLSDLGRFALSGSADGVRVLVNVGPTAASGDRQHRN